MNVRESVRRAHEQTRRVSDPWRPVAVWREKDTLDGRVVDSFVVVFRTVGCFWCGDSGCTMCGYYADTSPSVTPDALRKQFSFVQERYSGEPVVKIYTSGSFLDPREVPPEIAREVLDFFGEHARKVVVESRPEFVLGDGMELLKEHTPVVWVAIGLESASDEVLRKCVNKGFNVDLYVRAAERLRSAGIPLKTYVLLKPPFLSEWMAMEDAIRSVKFALQYSSEVSVNPVNVQRGTLVEWLWERGAYRPPWLWSVVEVLRRTHGMGRVVSYPTGAGKRRGAHNCGRCDEAVAEAIREYSLTGDVKLLENLDCECRERWAALLEYGRRTLNSDDV